jgi:predicted ester cyclase
MPRWLKGGVPMTAEQDKALVRRLVEEAVNPRNLDALEEVATGEFAVAARRWVGPFRGAFPDFKMEIVDLVADSGKVAAHFRCSGTHLGEWMGHPPTGRRFQDVDEIYIFRVHDGKLAGAFGSRTTWEGCASSASARKAGPLPRPDTGLPLWRGSAAAVPPPVIAAPIGGSRT